MVIRKRRPRSSLAIVYGVTAGTSAYSLLRGQLAWFAQQGWEVTLVTSPDEQARDAVSREGVRFEPVKMRREISLKSDIQSLFDWFRILRRVRPAVTNVGTPKAGLLGGLAAISTGVPRRIYVVRGLRLEGALNVARQALNLGAKRFVYVSSIKAVGERTANGRKLAPDHEPNPEDRYGASKLEAERALKRLSKERGLELVVVRPPLVYGAGAKGNVSTLVSLIDKQIPLPIGLIKNSRSFISVRNLSDFLIVCSVHPDAAGHIFHVSDGEDVSTRRLCQLLAVARGVRLREIPVPPGVIRLGASSLGRELTAQSLLGNLQVDISKNESVLGWVPPIAMEVSISESFAENESTRAPRFNRFLDIVLSGAGIVLLWPIMLIILFLGFLDTGSPLFRQTRVGQGEEAFTLLKFRTMKRDTQSVATHLVDGSKVTKLGSFLRKSKLDELPQLLNVLKGEMSLVGPRPCLPSQTKLIEERRKRGVFQSRPGVTGLAQVMGGVDMSEPVRLAELDSVMLRELRVASYFKFLLRTVFGEGRGDRVVS